MFADEMNVMTDAKGPTVDSRANSEPVYLQCFNSTIAASIAIFWQTTSDRAANLWNTIPR